MGWREQVGFCVARQNPEPQPSAFWGAPWDFSTLDNSGHPSQEQEEVPTRQSERPSRLGIGTGGLQLNKS